MTTDFWRLTECAAGHIRSNIGRTLLEEGFDATPPNNREKPPTKRMVGVTAAAGDTAMKYDLLIHKGQVVDGTGKPAFRADIGVVGNKIVEIGQLTLLLAQVAQNDTGGDLTR